MNGIRIGAILIEDDFLTPPAIPGARLLHIADAAGSIRCAITNYGARLVACMVSDKAGNATDVTLGYRKLAEYTRQPEDFMGPIVGRCANRIAGGHFTIAGKDYHTTQNEGTNTLHGGAAGLHGQIWEIAVQTPESITLRLLSPDGEEGFPGNLSIEITYTVSAGSTLTIGYRATTDAPTPVNLSSHAYWNLSGEGSDTITDHVLQLAAGAFTPVDPSLIPTGEIKPVEGTAFDFRTPQVIGSRIDERDAQLGYGHGYDHNWVLDGKEIAAVLYSPRSGITLHLSTGAPGIQFYSGNYFDGTRTGRSGSAYGYRSALALEPQAFPDSLHHPGFPDIVLQPGHVYVREDVYVFTNDAGQ